MSGPRDRTADEWAALSRGGLYKAHSATRATTYVPASSPWPRLMPVPAVHMCRGRRGSSFHTLAVSDSHPRTDARPCLARADLPPSLGCRPDRLLLVPQTAPLSKVVSSPIPLLLYINLYDEKYVFIYILYTGRHATQATPKRRLSSPQGRHGPSCGPGVHEFLF